MIGAGGLANVNVASAIGKGSAGGSSADLVLNGGTLQYALNTAPQSTDRPFSLGLGNGTIDSSSATAANSLSFTGTSAIGFNGQSGSRTLSLTGTNTGANTLAPVLGDSGGPTHLTKSGAGTWILTGNNTYTGTTTVSLGTLQIGNGGITGSLGTGFISGATATLETLSFNRSDNVTLSNLISGIGITIGALSATFDAQANAVMTIARPLAGAGNAVTKSGPGIVIFTQPNVYDTTNITGGTLALTGAGTVGTGAVTINGGALVGLPAGALVTIGAGGGSLIYPQIGAGADVSPTLTLTAGGLLTVDVVNSGGTVNFASAFGSGTTASFSKVGLGTLTLAGGATGNTFTGTTTAGAGTLALDFTTVSTPANGVIAPASPLTMRGGTLSLLGVSGASDLQTFASTALLEGGSTITATQNSAASLGASLGLISRDGTTNKGTINFILPITGGYAVANANNASGILGGWATVGGNSWATVTGGNIAAFAAEGALPATGGAATTNFSYGSATTITGSLTANAIKFTTTALTIALGTNNLTLSGNSGGLLTAVAAATISGTTTTTGTGFINAGASGELVVYASTGSTLTIGAGIGGTVAGFGLTKSGPGTLSLTNAGTTANNYTGVTTITGLGGRQASVLDFGVSNPGFISTTISGDAPKWNGYTGAVADNVWHVPAAGAPVNWKLITALTLTDFQANDQVLFNDTLDLVNNPGGNTVNILEGNVSPASVTFNNSTVGYTLTSTAVTPFGIAGGTSLVKSGTGLLTINNPNSFTGGVVINAGVVKLANASAIGTGNTLTFGASAAAGTKLQLFGNNATVTGLSTNAVPGSPVVENGHATTDTVITVNLASGTNTFAGALQNGAAARLGLAKQGAGTLILTGANTADGGNAVSAGRLQIGSGGTAGILAGDTSIAGAAVLDFNRSDASAYAGGVTGAGTFSVEGGGTLSITGNVAHSGGTVIAAATTLQIGNGGATGDLSGAGTIADNGTLAFNRTGSATVQAPIIGSGNLSVGNGVTAGTLILTGNNGYLGTTAIAAGATLQVGNGTASGTPGSAAGITNNGTFAYGRTDAQTYATLFNGTGALHVLSGTLTLIGDNNATYSGGTTVDNGAALIVGNVAGTAGAIPGFNGAGAGSLVADGTVTFRRTGTNAFDNPIGGAASGNVTLALGSWTFTNATTYAGSTTIQSGTTLNIAAGSGAGVGKGAISNAGALIFNRATPYALTLSGVATLDMGTGALGNALVFAQNASFASGTLQIWNWTQGGYMLGSDDNGALDDPQDRFLFNGTGSGLAADRLANIQFFSDAGMTPIGTGAAEISFGAQFEIVPVPEPATVALLGSVALCALIGYRERRRVA